MRNDSFLIPTSIYSHLTAYEDGTECSESRHINSRRRVIIQKKAYNIQNTAKAWNQEIVVWFPTAARDSVSSSGRLYGFLDPTSLLFKGYRWLFTSWKSSRSIKFATLLHLMPRIRISGNILPLFHVPSWRAQTTVGSWPHNVLPLYDGIWFVTK